VGEHVAVAARPVRPRLERVGDERTLMHTAPYVVVLLLGCGGRLADDGSEAGRGNADASAARSSSLGSSGVDLPPDCTPEVALNCPGSSQGYSCATNPEVPGSWLACSAPTATSDYCCMAWNHPIEPCVGDNRLTTACSVTADTLTTFVFQCNNEADSPSTLNAALVCDAGIPDPDGIHADFCCHF
jgi:hypothetical protein